MKNAGWICLVLAVPGGVACVGAVHAADVSSPRLKASVDCRAPDAPYRNYDCLDAYLGDGFLERLVNYYRLEWGHEGPPADPKAPPPHRAGWPDSPATVPPFPFTEWPYGGATSIGVTRPSSADSPLMVALANTDFGKTLNANNLQIYGWINGGGNISTNTVRPGGNWPASYDYTPNTFQLDQAVVYFERVPDTVQTDHIDWGFRLSAIYGENYRYTTAYGLASYQLLGHNLNDGYDFPMIYGELYIPQVAEGLLLRFGRFISLPDIEAQLAPNNYMYTHSMTYTFDNYTNTGSSARSRSTRTGSSNWASRWAPRRCRGTGARRCPIRSPIRCSRATPCSGIPAPSRPSRPASAGRATAAGTTSTWWPTPSTMARGDTITFSGRASPGIIASTASGISPGKPTNSARGTC
jgi:hypothetical protein